MGLAKKLGTLGFTHVQSKHVGHTYANLAGAGASSQADAAEIATEIVAGTPGGVTNSFRLRPAASCEHAFCFFTNVSGAEPARLFPAVGEQIYPEAVNDPITVAPLKTRILAQFASNAWLATGDL